MRTYIHSCLVELLSAIFVVEVGVNKKKTQVCERSVLHLPDKLGELISSIVHVFPSHTKHKICHNLVWGIKLHRTTKVNVLKLLAGPVSMVTTLFAHT